MPNEIQGNQPDLWFGIASLTRGPRSLSKTFLFEPALNIEGIQSGYQGQGVKTILPAEASAKLEVRLVPGLEPHDVLEKFGNS